jgi:hypothetical protein
MKTLLIIFCLSVGSLASAESLAPNGNHVSDSSLPEPALGVEVTQKTDSTENTLDRPCAKEILAELVKINPRTRYDGDRDWFYESFPLYAQPWFQAYNWNDQIMTAKTTEFYADANKARYYMANYSIEGGRCILKNFRLYKQARE